MKDENLNIWNFASTPDISATKKANVSGQNQTSISGYWFFHEATKKFGPAGIGWGWDVLEERFDIGVPAKITVNGADHLIDTKIHTLKVKLWYVLDDKRGEIIQYGHTPAIYASKHGASMDGEAPKKSLTDALKKALSMLGFASDVFMGMFDDQDYVNAVIAEQTIDKAESKEAESDKQKDELQAMVIKHLDLMKNAVTLPEAKGILKFCRTLETRKAIPVLREICERGLIAMNKTFDNKKQELENVKSI